MPSPCAILLWTMKGRGTSHHVRSPKKVHAGFWAALTIVSFPIVAMSVGWFGFNALSSFALGACASIAILILEGIVTAHWWFLEPEISRILDTPELSIRMLVVIGIIVFVFQSLVLVVFMTSPMYDGNVLNLVLSRQCNNPSNPFFGKLCASALQVSGSRDVDIVSAAIRDAAEKRFFSGGLVTCAVRAIATQTDTTTFQRGSLIRCDRWALSKIANEPIRIDTVKRTVVAKVSVQQDGTYRVDGWSDDPTSKDWDAVGGAAATPTVMLEEGVAEQTGLRDALAQETFRRVMEKLSKW
jgi:hypothetical protein